MAEESEPGEVQELRALLENNRQAIEQLHQMVANMEVLLARLNEARKRKETDDSAA